MDRSRELALQRVSRIGSLAAAENAIRDTKFRGRPTGALTIEAAIATYMTKDDAYGRHRQKDAYIRTSNDPDREQMAWQMAEYMSDLEDSQLSDAREDLEKKHPAQHIDVDKIKKVLADDPSAQYQLSHYKKDGDGQTAFDRLDANRCSGFLLYSYDKKGVHSVLGERISPGVRSTHAGDGRKRSKLWI